MKKNFYLSMSLGTFILLLLVFGLNSSFIKSNKIETFDTDQQASIFLKEHNRIRAERGLPALKWSKELSNYAREWANNLSSSCNLQHRQNNKYGENLAMANGMGNNPATYVKLWESEKTAFDAHFGNKNAKCCGGNFAGYGHYSQIVWRTTTQVGCAMVTCADGSTMVVCNYNPAGNMQGGKPY